MLTHSLETCRIFYSEFLKYSRIFKVIISFSNGKYSLNIINRIIIEISWYKFRISDKKCAISESTVWVYVSVISNENE